MSNYPNKCPKCGSPAYVGLNNIDCSSVACTHGPKLRSTGNAFPSGSRPYNTPVMYDGRCLVWNGQTWEPR